MWNCKITFSPENDYELHAWVECWSQARSYTPGR